MPDPSEITQLLEAISDGDGKAFDQLAPLVYKELRQLAGSYMQNEPAAHTLQATALVNEVYLKLADQDRVDWRGRSHFFAICAQAMRRILVDHARKKKRVKRGGGNRPLSLDENLTLSPQHNDDLIALDDALEALATLDARQAKIVELRFFAGMTVEEVAEVLGVSKRTVESEWTAVRAWLRRELSENA